jgi:hypothetical protein
MTVASLYETDFHAWAQDQAAKLHKLAAERSNSELDLVHLAEEVESMAGSDRRELVSRLTIVIVHMLKLAYCFYPDPRKTWLDSVQAQRKSLDILFDQSPSLRRLAPELLGKAYRRALQQARLETVDLSMDELPAVSPFTLEDLLDATYVPEPPVRFDA